MHVNYPLNGNPQFSVGNNSKTGREMRVSSSISLPQLFGHTHDQLIYFHAPDASPEQLELASGKSCIFEIDLAWAHTPYHDRVQASAPYIGHPEEFYTKMGKPFPKKNVTLDAFKLFLRENPSIKVLLDVKDVTVLPYLEEFIDAVGPERCIVHAFIKNWTDLPEEFVGKSGEEPTKMVEPHWYREDIDLFKLDNVLSPLHVPLIANCRGFSDDNVSKHQLIERMIQDSKRCPSVASLGLYYPGAPLPDTAFLERFNQAGYYGWVNANREDYQAKIGTIKHVAMCDDVRGCSNLR